MTEIQRRLSDKLFTAFQQACEQKDIEVAEAILKALERQHPNADTELHYSNPYELLVATILSAQCTDERVNQVTPALFKRYPDAAALANATTAELEPQIQSTGFFRAKSKSLLGMAKAPATVTVCSQEPAATSNSVNHSRTAEPIAPGLSSGR